MALARLAERVAGWLDHWRGTHGISLAQHEVFRREGGGRLLLHAGCGGYRKKDILSPPLRSARWREIRLDIDPTAQPDILGDVLDMRGVPDGAVDAVYSAHMIEHLPYHDVPRALSEMTRVLAPDGLLVAVAPDLQQAARMIADGRLFDLFYESAAGPVTPYDVVFGYRPYLREHPYMAHRGGFTADSLAAALREAGFPSVAVRAIRLDLYALASRVSLDDNELQRQADVFFPE